MCVYVNSSMNISVPTPYLQCMVCQLRQQTEVVVVVIQFPVEDQHVCRFYFNSVYYPPLSTLYVHEPHKMSISAGMGFQIVMHGQLQPALLQSSLGGLRIHTEDWAGAEHSKCQY